MSNNIAEIPNEVKLVHELMEKLEQNTPFSMDDERHFFGGLNNEYIWGLYFQAAFIELDTNAVKEGKSMSDWAKWKKAPPKYALFGELIRMNRDKLLLTDSPLIYYLPNATYVGKKGNLEDIKYSILRHVIVQKKSNAYSSGKTVFFELYSNGNKSDTFIYSLNHIEVNGDNLFTAMGFSKASNKSPYQYELSPMTLEKLLEHIKPER